MAGKPLAHPALKANGVEIAVLSQDQIAAERKKAEDAERGEAKKEGITDDGDDQVDGRVRRSTRFRRGARGRSSSA